MKQQKQLVVLIVLLLIAGGIWYYYFVHDKPVVTADANSAAQNYQLLSVDNPQLHTDREKRARETEYKSTGRNIFSAVAPPPPVPQGLGPKPNDPKHPVAPIPPPPPPIPVASPLPVKFFGYGTIPTSASRRAFFTDGEDVYIVAEGEVLLNRFRILKIGNVNLEYEEISSGLRATAPLEDQGAPPSA
jgi:hypothetical protein